MNSFLDLTMLLVALALAAWVYFPRVHKLIERNVERVAKWFAMLTSPKSKKP